MMSFFEYHKKDKLKNEKQGTFMEKYLGIGKYPRKYKWVWEEWEKEPLDERKYNMADTEGCAGVEQIFNPSEDCFNRATFSGASWDAGMSASRLHDLVNLHLYKDCYYLDSKSYDDRHERIWLWGGFSDEKVGGFNKEVNKGMHRMAIGLDFNKFYPMAGIGSNCAPETFVNMTRLKLDKRGLVVVDKRPYLKHEVTDWPAFVKECKELRERDALTRTLAVQDVITNDLIGWKETEYLWGDLIVTPAGLFRKDIIAKNVKAFQDMLKNRKALQKIADKILEAIKDKDAFEYVLADLRQFSYKQYMNGRFGVQGLESDRLYMLALFNTYTLVCQEIIKECIRYIEEELVYPVNLASTDSMFVDAKLPPKWIEDKGKVYLQEAEWLSEKVQEHAQEFAMHEFNISDPSVFTLECDVICKTMFIENMRFYIKNVMWSKGVILDPPQLEFKGMKKVRREVAAITEDVQERLGKIYMNDGTFQDIQNEVKKLHAEFSSKPLWEVCKSLPVNQPLDDYAETSEQFKAFTMADKYFGLDVSVGERFYVAPVKYCPPAIKGIKVDPRLGDVLAFDEDTLPAIEAAGIVIDVHELEDKAVASPADEILEMFGTGYWKILSAARIADTTGEF
jgi:DNA polymerase elongation subunit (family B)